MSPATNTAKNVKERDSSIRRGIDFLYSKNIYKKTHTHIHIERFQQSRSVFKTFRLVDSLAEAVDGVQ